MKNNFKKRTLALLLMAAMVIGVFTISNADINTTSTLTANPGSQEIRLGHKITSKLDIPVYAIIQPGAVNGSNYVKLRDIANAVDFGVEWNAAEPNTMRIYTNRHYDGTGVSKGAATEAKVATPSTMSIYIDNKLVDPGDLKIYLIDNQNFFAIRDLAKLVDFGCFYMSTGNYVALETDVRYAPTTTTPDVPRVIEYENITTTFPRTYGAPSGDIATTPHTVTPQDPMAREDYWNTYASAEAKAAFDRQLAKTNKYGYNVDEVNAIIQTLIDLPKIRALEGTPRAAMNYVPAHYFVQDLDKIVQGQDKVFAGTHVPLFADITISSNSGLTYFDARLYDTQIAFAKASEVAPVLATLEGKTTREQANIIIQAICDKFQYGGTGPKPSADYSKLASMWSDGKVYSGICSDYEDAMRYWFNYVGIPYFYVGTSDHAWGKIYLVEEDKWVAVDATWADGGTPGGNFAKYAISDPDTHYREVSGSAPNPKIDAHIIDTEIMELGMRLRNK